MNITNPKIERKKADIARTEMNLAEIKARLRKQKDELIDLENDEIVAMFRSECINEDILALLRSRRETETGGGEDDSDNEQPIFPHKSREGEKSHVFSEN